MIARNPTKSDLEAAREQHEAAQLQLETARMDRLAEAESLSASVVPEFREAWGDVVDPQEHLYDDPQTGLPRFMGDHAEIRDGKQGIAYSSEQDLAEQRAIGRVLAGSTPGKGIVRNLTNFTIGTGFTYTAQAKGNHDAPDGLVESLQEILDDFCEDNRWTNDLDRELREREEKDGEWFLALYATHSGHTQARVVEPEQITEPDGKPTDGEDWTFGVITAEGDVQDVRGYWAQQTHGGPLEVLDADMVVHSKNNVPRNLKRGVSSFKAVHQELLDGRKVLRNTAKGSAVQAAIAWIEEMAQGVTQGQAESLRNANTTMRFEQPTPRGYTGSRTRNVERVNPGTVMRTESGRKFHPGPLGSSRAPNFLAVSQACVRAAGAAWCMPEYMVTADASNSNFASTMVAESPFVKHCEAEQQRVAVDHKQVMWVAVANAYRAGRLYRYGLTLRQIKRVVEISVDVPRVAARDDDAEATKNETLYRNGVLSAETWAGMAGLDYAEEQERGAKPQATAWPVPTNGEPVRPSAVPTPESNLQRAADLLWENYP